MTRWAKTPEWLIGALNEHCPTKRGASAGSAVIVWNVLAARHASRDGRTPPVSQARLAEEAGVSIPTVQRALYALQAVKALDAIGTRRGVHRGPSRFRLHFDAPKASPVMARDSQGITGDGEVRETAGQSVALPSPVMDESREENPEGASARAGARSPLEEQQLGLIGEDGEVDEWQAAAAARARVDDPEATDADEKPSESVRQQIGALAALLRDEGRVPQWGRNASSG